MGCLYKFWAVSDQKLILWNTFCYKTCYLSLYASFFVSIYVLFFCENICEIKILPQRTFWHYEILKASLTSWNSSLIGDRHINRPTDKQTLPHIELFLKTWLTTDQARPQGGEGYILTDWFASCDWLLLWRRTYYTIFFRR